MPGHPVAWCHGAAGIGQMHAAVSPLGIGDPAAMDHALEATTSEGSAVISLEWPIAETERYVSSSPE